MGLLQPHACLSSTWSALPVPVGLGCMQTLLCWMVVPQHSTGVEHSPHNCGGQAPALDSWAPRGPPPSPISHGPLEQSLPPTLGHPCSHQPPGPEEVAEAGRTAATPLERVAHDSHEARVVCGPREGGRWAASAVAIKVLDGTTSVSTAAPPIPLRSMRVTSAPSCTPIAFAT